MRKFEQDENLITVPIKSNPKSRDDVPALLLGLQQRTHKPMTATTYR